MGRETVRYMNHRDTIIWTMSTRVDKVNAYERAYTSKPVYTCLVMFSVSVLEFFRPENCRLQNALVDGRRKRIRQILFKMLYENMWTWPNKE